MRLDTLSPIYVYFNQIYSSGVSMASNFKIQIGPPGLEAYDIH